MSRSARAVAALVRWRAFGESRARETLARRAHETQEATAKAEASEHARDAIAAQRLDLLQSPALDLAWLEAARAIEHAADVQLDADNEARDDARNRHSEAQQRYLAARAQSRVAETRDRRISSAAHDQREKRLFDWMADLHASRRSTS